MDKAQQVLELVMAGHSLASAARELGFSRERARQLLATTGNTIRDVKARRKAIPVKRRVFPRPPCQCGAGYWDIAPAKGSKKPRVKCPECLRVYVLSDRFFR